MGGSKMARETKAQREAREAAEHQAAWDKFREEYPQRFAKVLFAFTRLDVSGAHLESEPYQVDQLDEETYAFVHDYTDATLKVTAPVNQVWDVLYTLERLEGCVESYDRARAEEQRKADVRKAALWKLTDEEREVLGL